MFLRTVSFDYISSVCLFLYVNECAKKVSNFMNDNFHRVFAHVYRKYSCQQKLINGFTAVGIEGMK